MSCVGGYLTFYFCDETLTGSLARDLNLNLMINKYFVFEWMIDKVCQ